MRVLNELELGFVAGGRITGPDDIATMQAWGLPAEPGLGGVYFAPELAAAIMITAGVILVGAVRNAYNNMKSTARTLYAQALTLAGYPDFVR